MKPFVFVGDVHLRSSNPRAWKVSYKEEVLRHLEFINELSQKVGACAVVFGGDIGHEPDWKMSLLNRTSRILEEFKVPIYSAVGNHDVFNKSLATYDETALWALEDKGVLQVPDTGNSQIVDGWEFTFFHSDTPEAEQLVSGTWPAPVKGEGVQYTVAIAHVPVGPNATPTQRAVGSLLIPGFDLVCVADIHKPFPPTKLKSGCVVVNVGVLERMTREERAQIPQVAVVWSPDRIEYVPVEGAKPVEDLFNPAFLQEKEINEALGEEFLEKLEDLAEEESESEEDAVRNLGVALGMPEDVISLALECMK